MEGVGIEKIVKKLQVCIFYHTDNLYTGLLEMFKISAQL